MGGFQLKQVNRGIRLGFLMPMLVLVSQLSIGKDKFWTKKTPPFGGGESEWLLTLKRYRRR